MSRLVKGDQIVVDTIFMLCRNISDQQDTISDGIPDRQTATDDVLGNIQQQADLIINHALVFREQTMKQAEDEAVKVYENARQSGYKKGYADGLKEAEEKNRAAADALVELIGQIDRSRDNLLEENRSLVIMLACDIARKIIDKQLDCEDEAFINIFKKTVCDLYDKKHIRLKTSKFEKCFVTSNADYLLSLVKGAERLEFEVLEDAERGTCIIETDDGIIDASVQKQTDILEQVLLEL